MVDLQRAASQLWFSNQRWARVFEFKLADGDDSYAALGEELAIPPDNRGARTFWQRFK